MDDQLITTGRYIVVMFTEPREDGGRWLRYAVLDRTEEETVAGPFPLHEAWRALEAADRLNAQALGGDAPA